jgi:dihydroorotate dehydrogenase (fumarate)
MSTIDISTRIADISLSSCLMNASGCHCTTENEWDDLRNSQLGAIVSKSSTIEPRAGNYLPRFYIDQYGSINSMGIPNHGYDFYSNYGISCHQPFIQSIYPFNTVELKKMLENINNTSQSDPHGSFTIKVSHTAVNISSFTYGLLLQILAT